MKILYLGNKKNKKIFSFLSNFGEVFFNDKEFKLLDYKKFDWIISYGYRHIILKDHLDKLKNPIINMHISYLPFNRGAHPNYWSFKDNSPKGVTIHFIDNGIDTGPILVQKKQTFSENDTLQTSYFKLKKTIEDLFCDSFPKIITNQIIPKPQIGNGSFHIKKDLPENINWNTKIKEI